MNINTKKIKELIDLMNENGLSQVEVEQEGSKVKLMKGPGGVIEQVIAPALQTKVAASPEAAPKAPAAGTNLREVKSPMVGTFYKSPGPDADAYVEVGDTVQKGDVLCIVEAMKLMNEVKAEFGGKIVEISVDNAEPVEFGQTLFMVEPV